ncbi:MAG: DciA family protein [Planctomycetota bacterium]|jgi:predicted nucleic acid-binding Zn ribbon protein
MDDSERLNSLGKVSGQGRSEPGTPATLGDAVTQFMNDRVSPRQAKWDAVSQAWDQLLPAELSRHCRLADISGGQLKVVADSPVYMHELQMCSSELLGELRRRCPRARINRIKLALGNLMCDRK